MSNFAELKLVADTRGMDKAVASLERTAKAGRKTEESVDRVGDEFTKTGRKAEIAARQLISSTSATSASTAGLARAATGATGVTSNLTAATNANTVATHKMAAAHGHAKMSMLGMIPGMVAMAAGMAAVLAVTNSIGAARGFQAAMAETSTLIAGTAAEMALLDAESKRLASTYGGAATDQVNAFYQAISAGADGVSGATVILDQANKLAIGGVTDVTTAVDVLTTAVNVYAADGLSASDASDALFVSMKAGKTTITELSSAIGNVLPISQAAGVSFDETAAAIAALTKGGISTTRSVTALRSILSQIITPSEQASKAAEKLGLDFSASALASKGFGGFMEELIEKTGGSTEALASLLPSLEGLPAVLAFAGQGGKFFAANMEEMAIKAGATEEAFGKMSKNINQRLIVALGKLGVLAQNLGNSLLTALVPSIEALATSLEFVTGNFDIIGTAMIGMTASLIPAMIAGLGPLTLGIGATTAALGKMAVAMWAATGPIGITVGVLASAAAYFLIFRDSAAESSEAQKALNNALKVYAQTDGPMARAEVVASAKAYIAETKAKLDSAQATLDSARIRQQAGQALLDQNPLTAGDQSGMGAAMAANLEQSQLAVDLLNAKLQRTLAELGRIKPETDGTAVALDNASNAAGSLADGLGTATGLASLLRQYLTALPGALAGAEAEISSLQAGIANLASGGDEASSSIERYRAELLAAAGPLDELPSKIRDMALAGIQQQVALKKKAQELTQEYNSQVTALAKVEEASGKVGSAGNVAAADIATAFTSAKSAAEGLAGTISGTMGAGFRSIIDGTKTVSSAFRSMARDIIAQLFDVLVVQRLVGSVGTATTPGSGLAGLLGGLFAGKSFEGGGFTGSGARSGGIDGRGGFPAILHPNETVVDNTRGSPQRGGTIVIEQNLNFSVGVVQTVRAEVMSMMPQIAEVTKGAVLDARQRGGSFARGMGV